MSKPSAIAQRFKFFLCIVAKNRHKFRREGEKLYYLSESPKDPSLFAITPLGMAGPPLAASARRLYGSFYVKMFLLIIDVHSKWIDIHCLNSAMSCVTVDKMRSTFASHGFNFVSSEKNGFKHIT